LTFTVTRLAPGDPASLKAYGAGGFSADARSRQLSKEDVENNRRILGLDKPVLLNIKQKGRRHYVLRTLRKVASPDEVFYESGRNDLEVVGTAALPEVFEQAFPQWCKYFGIDPAGQILQDLRELIGIGLEIFHPPLGVPQSSCCHHVHRPRNLPGLLNSPYFPLDIP